MFTFPVSHWGSSYIPQTTGAVKFPDSTSYLYRDAKLGAPLTFTHFMWIKIPTGNNLGWYAFQYGSFTTEDPEAFPGIACIVVAQNTAVSTSPCALVFQAYSFDGFTQMLKFTARNRNAANTANTFPLQRDKWYGVYFSINFDDGNNCSFSIGENGHTPSGSTWFGDTDPSFPTVPFLPVTTFGPSTYQMGVTYSLGGGEAACETGHDTVSIFMDAEMPPFVSNQGKFSFYQYWSDSNNYDTTPNAYLRFMTNLCHPINLGSSGEIPFGSQPFDYLNNTAATYSTNAGFGGNYTSNDTIDNVTGPV